MPMEVRAPPHYYYYRHLIRTTPTTTTNNNNNVKIFNSTQTFKNVFVLKFELILTIGLNNVLTEGARKAYCGRHVGQGWSRQFWILNILQPYRPPRPVTGIALLFFLKRSEAAGNTKSCSQRSITESWLQKVPKSIHATIAARICRQTEILFSAGRQWYCKGISTVDKKAYSEVEIKCKGDGGYFH
jgi:hypothetical protein